MAERLNIRNDQITGIIMAGGKSSRMGADKGLIEFKGKPLVKYAIDCLSPFCEKLILSTQNKDYAQFGLPLLADEIPNCGPLGGIYTALKTGSDRFIFILGCDLPYLSRGSVQKLIENISGYDCIVPKIGDKIEPLCAIYSRSLLPEIEKRIKLGKLAIYSLIELSNCCYVPFDLDIPDFQNINTPNDLYI